MSVLNYRTSAHTLNNATGSFKQLRVLYQYLKIAVVTAVWVNACDFYFVPLYLVVVKCGPYPRASLAYLRFIRNGKGRFRNFIVYSAACVSKQYAGLVSFKVPFKLTGSAGQALCYSADFHVYYSSACHVHQLSGRCVADSVAKTRK